MNTGGISPDQAPPLAIPASFFLVAPAGLAAAGALLLWQGTAPLSTPWVPLAAGLAHLGTLGVLGAVMFGALYQMVPVVAGASVPRARLAHGVHALLVLGVGGLVVGFVRGGGAHLWWGLVPLTLALAGFLLPVGFALFTARGVHPAVRGMRLALLHLIALASIGLYLGFGQATGHWPQLRQALVGTHVSLGLVGWVGGLLTAVSWQIVPMFFVTPEFPRWATRAGLLAGLLTLLLVPASLLITPPWSTQPAALAAIPGALAVWLIHPLVTARLLLLRTRARPDVALRFWYAGLALGPLGAGLYAASYGVRGVLDIAGAWVLIVGWAGLILHGMLNRIVAFLVWFHRFSPLIGQQRVPSMRDLMPESGLQQAHALHLLTVFLGLGAVLSGQPWLARAAGLGLVLTGLRMALNLVGALRRMP